MLKIPENKAYNSKSVDKSSFADIIKRRYSNADIYSVMLNTIRKIERKKKMKNKFRILAMILAVAMCVGLLGGCGEAKQTPASDDQNTVSADTSAAPTYKLTVAVGFNEDQPGAFALKKFAEDIGEKSNGALSVEVFYGSVLGSDTEFTDSVIQGNITMAIPGSSSLNAYVPQLSVIDTPFLFSSVEQARATLDSDAGQALLDAMSAVGLKGLCFWENGGFRELTANKEIRSPEDLSGMKIRVMQSDLHMALWSALGANPAALAYSELYTALQQGAFDCEENPLSNIYSAKFYEVQKYIINTNHMYAAYIVFMNEQFWNELPDEYKTIIMDSLYECREYERQICSDNDADLHSKLEDNGVTFIDLSDAELQAFRDRLDGVYKSISDSVGQENFDSFCAAAAANA